MANLAKWAAGTVSYASTSAGFSSADLLLFNSAASGSGAVASTAVANSTNLDLIGEVSFAFTANANTGATAQVDVYLLPLNYDGTTYGDGTAAGVLKSTAPGQSYRVATVNVPSGTTACRGTTRPFSLPRGDFVLAVFPTCGTLSATAGAAIQLRTTVENLNG